MKKKVLVCLMTSLIALSSFANNNSQNSDELTNEVPMTLEFKLRSIGSETVSSKDEGLTVEHKKNNYDAIILAVGHNEFKEMGADQIRALGKAEHVLYDLKYVLPRQSVDMRL